MMNTKIVNEQLSLHGFDLNFSVAGSFIGVEQLHLVSHIESCIFLEVLENPSHELTKCILQFPDIVDILIESYNQAQLPIPGHILIAGHFQYASLKKDQKQLDGAVKNGLYTFLKDYQAAIPYAVKKIKRRDNSSAFIIENAKALGHLSIDEFYADEHEHGKSIYHYAHVSMLKAGVNVRIYFSEDLKVIKTTAYLEDEGHKIQRVNVADLDIKVDDYQVLLDVLKTLRAAHLQQIQELELHFMPHFMFIKDVADLERCRDEITRINELKSPYVDKREAFLQKQFEAPKTQTQLNKDLELTACEAGPSHVHTMVQGKSTSNRLPAKLKTEKKLEKIKAATQEMDALIAKIYLLMDGANKENLNIVKILVELLSAESLCIHYMHELSIDIKKYEAIIEGLKLYCFEYLHQAYLEGDKTFLDLSYQEGKLYIDALIYGYLTEMVGKINQASAWLEETECQKIRKLTDLLSFYFDKDKLFKRFFLILIQHISFRSSNEMFYGFLMRFLSVVQDPSLLLFLLEKNVIKETDCIAIINLRYVSVIQFILFNLTDFNSSVLDFCLRKKTNILEISNTLPFDSLIESPDAYDFGSYKACQLSADKTAFEKQIYIKNISKFRGQIKALGAIEFAQGHSYHVSLGQVQLNCQKFFLPTPNLALQYLAVLLSRKSIQQRIVISQFPQLLLFHNNDESELAKLEIKKCDQAKLAMTYLFCPVDDSSMLVKQQMDVAINLFECIKRQSFLTESRNDDAVFLSIMQDLKDAANGSKKIIVAFSAIIYILCSPWDAKIFKKYIFFMLRYIESLASLGMMHFIEAYVALLDEMLNGFGDETLSLQSKLKILNCLKSINAQYEEKIEIPSFLLDLESPQEVENQARAEAGENVKPILREVKI